MASVQHGFMGNPLMGLMVGLCGWNKPPSGMEDDFEDLMDDPDARLSKGSVEFPNLGLWMYLIWLPLVLVSEVLIKILIYDKATDIGRQLTAWGFGISILLVYLIGNLILLQRRLKLDALGFHIIQGGKDTLVPWTTLQSGRDWSLDFFQIKIPVVSTAKDEISITADTITRTISGGAKPSGLHFNNEAEISVIWPFHLDPRRFAFIAQQMYSAATSENSSDRRPAVPIHSRFDEQFDQLPAGVKILSNGVLQVPVAAVTFPDICCRCEVQTDSTRKVGVQALNYWWLPSRMNANLEMPVCERCWRNSTMRLLALLASIEATWTLLTIYLIYGSFVQSLMAYAVVALLAIIPTRFTLPLVPALWWRVAKIALNLNSNEFRFRFASANFRDRMLEAIRHNDQFS